MEYIKVIDGQPVRYTIEEFFEEHPGVNVYTKVKEIPDKKVLAQYDVYPFITSSHPEEGHFREGTPQRLYNGDWVQTWEVLDPGSVAPEDPIDQPSNVFFATPEQKLERFNICQACDRWKASTRQCKECGCFMDIKTKIKGTECPLGKWGKIV
jgi:hypothetical protein